LHDRYVSGRGLDNRTGAFIVAETLKRLSGSKCQVGVYAASTVNEETNMGGAYFAASGVQPTVAIACDVTFATDYPGVDTNKHGDVTLEGGPVLAKGAPINRKMNGILEKTAIKKRMNIQYELTSAVTGTDADRMRIIDTVDPISLVSLPFRYMHSRVEKASVKDIEEVIDLNLGTIESLPGKEQLHPLQD